MKDLLDKLTSYNIFNYLFPGVVFTVILSKVTPYNLLQQDFIVGAFLYYFIGLVISRIGSLLIEPFLKYINFLKFSDYPDFVKASKVDEKIDTFSEVNNMYRTITSMFLTLVLIKGFVALSKYWLFLKNWEITILTLFLLTLFLFSYRKQTSYITKRIEANLK